MAGSRSFFFAPNITSQLLQYCSTRVPGYQTNNALFCPPIRESRAGHPRFFWQLFTFHPSFFFSPFCSKKVRPQSLQPQTLSYPSPKTNSHQKRGASQRPLSPSFFPLLFDTAKPFRLLLLRPRPAPVPTMCLLCQASNLTITLPYSLPLAY